jgi:hypothetical protein
MSGKDQVVRRQLHCVRHGSSGLGEGLLFMAGGAGSGRPLRTGLRASDDANEQERPKTEQKTTGLQQELLLVVR